MVFHIIPDRIIGRRDMAIYGQFLEHFHRQIYGGIYDPGNPLSDGDGFREDVIEALKAICTPIIRWPGGCFVSSYHWRDGVGFNRQPSFDKAWRVEDSNAFGTDEFVKFCRKLGAEPYICTNAGTGTMEEMSDWVEYCNLESEGRNARLRIANGSREPFSVHYWSVGNENYGAWELGAKTASEWGTLVAESAKLMRHVDPTIELTAAALSDVDWNISLLKHAGDYLDWISIHEYWDRLAEVNDPADYETVIAMTDNIDHSIKEVRGLLDALGLSGRIKIAFDEWNLRGWHHPKVHRKVQGVTKEEYLYPRDLNDDNSTYTTADAVFSACFLNALNRHSDIVRMAAFAPAVNTRGCIFTYDKGIVLRSTYYVFRLYTEKLGDIIIDSWMANPERISVFNRKEGKTHSVDECDLLATAFSDRPGYAIAAVNKNSSKPQSITIDLEAEGTAKHFTIAPGSVDSYNDVDRTEVRIEEKDLGPYRKGMELQLAPHSVSVLQIGV